MLKYKLEKQCERINILKSKTNKYRLINKYAVFLKSASFVSFTDKNLKCLTEIKILSVRMSDTKIQDVLHRTRTCLTENYPVWHDESFCQTKCLTSFKSFQEVWIWQNLFTVFPWFLSLQLYFLCIQVLTVLNFVVLLRRCISCKSVRNGKIRANEHRNIWSYLS